MGSGEPRLSVIVPSFNHARYLDRRMRSILEQTVQNFEILFLDDASTDESLSVADRYRTDSRVRIYQNPVNSGSPFIQWNRGVGRARGEYVWIAESDDSADPRLLESLTGLLDAHPDVGLAYCQSLIVDDADRVLHPWAPQWGPSRVWSESFVQSGRTRFWKNMVEENVIPNASAVVFRKTVYEQVGGAPEDFRLAGDYMLWLKMMTVSDVAFEARPLNHFRQHEATVRHKSDRDGIALEEGYRVLRYLKDHFPEAAGMLLQPRNRLLKDWVLFLMSRPGRRLVEQNRRILEAARHIEDHVYVRLLDYGIRWLWVWMVSRFRPSYAVSYLQHGRGT